MSQPKTLLELAGTAAKPLALDDSAVLMIDAQLEYVDGKVPLVGIGEALEQGALLLARARELERPIIHVQHKGRSGGLFDPESRHFQIAPEVAPLEGEAVVKKALPSAFAATDLEDVIEMLDVGALIVAGFMTHMCVSTTVRAALDRGIPCTVVGAACATRDLPGARGGVLAAAQVHQVELAALADRFCAVVETVDDLAGN